MNNVQRSTMHNSRTKLENRFEASEQRLKIPHVVRSFLPKLFLALAWPWALLRVSLHLSSLLQHLPNYPVNRLYSFKIIARAGGSLN